MRLPDLAEASGGSSGNAPFEYIDCCPCVAHRIGHSCRSGRSAGTDLVQQNAGSVDKRVQVLGVANAAPGSRAAALVRSGQPCLHRTGYLVDAELGKSQRLRQDADQRMAAVVGGRNPGRVIATPKGRSMHTVHDGWMERRDVAVGEGADLVDAQSGHNLVIPRDGDMIRPHPASRPVRHYFIRRQKAVAAAVRANSLLFNGFQPRVAQVSFTLPPKSENS